MGSSAYDPSASTLATRPSSSARTISCSVSAQTRFTVANPAPQTKIAKPTPATPAQRKRAVVTAVLLAAFAVVVYVTVMLQIAAH